MQQETATEGNSITPTKKNSGEIPEEGNQQIQSMISSHTKLETQEIQSIQKESQQDNQEISSFNQETLKPQLSDEQIAQKNQQSTSPQQFKTQQSSEIGQNDEENTHHIPQIQEFSNNQNLKTEIKEEQVQKNIKKEEEKGNKVHTFCYKEHKIHSFEELKEFLEFKSKNLKQHFEICQTLKVVLDKRVKQSNTGIQQVQAYFNFRKEKEQAYAKLLSSSSQPKLAKIYHDFEGKKSYFPKLSEILSKTDTINDLQAKKINEFANYIKTSIIEGQMVNEQKEFNSNIRKMQDQINQSFNKIEKEESKYKKFHQKYHKIYENQTSQKEDTKNRKDLYNWEQKFKRSLFAVINSQKQLGKNIMDYYEEIQRLECRRIESIQQCLQLYLSMNLKVYGMTQDQEQINLELSQIDLFEEGQKGYNIEELLTEGHIIQIKMAVNKGEICPNLTFEQLKQFLFQFPIPKEDCLRHHNHKLVIKKFNAYNDVGTIGTTWNPIKVIFTVDNHLLLFDEPSAKDIDKRNKEFEKTKLKIHESDSSFCKMRCEWISIEEKGGKNHIVNILETEPGFLFNSKNKVKIKFDTNDRMEEFVTYMKIHFGEKILKNVKKPQE